MSKSSWTLLGCLLLVLAGCGGRSSNTDSVRNLDKVGDAGGGTSSEPDSGEPEPEAAPTMLMDAGAAPSLDSGTPAPATTTTTPVPSTPMPVDGGSPDPVVAPTTEPPAEPEMLPEPATDPPVDIDEGECQGYHSPGATDCSIQLACPEQYLNATCHQNGDRWVCECSHDRRYVAYDLAGVDGANACLTMRDLCEMDPAELQFDGEVTCNAGTFGDALSCQFHDRCGPSADVGGGITAYRIESDQYAQCSEDPSIDAVRCSCQAGAGHREAFLSGVTFPEACEVAYASCALSTDVPVDDVEECADPYTSESTTTCSMNQQCTRSTTLPDGGSVEVLRSRGASCMEAGDTWECLCDYGSELSIGLDLDPRATPAETCTDAMELCATAQGVEPTEPLVCEFLSRNGAPGSCGQTQQCRASALVDDLEVEVFGYITANCSDTGEGAWSCECYSDRLYDAFELSTSDESAEVCDAAAVQCESLLDMGFTASGG